MHEDRDHHLDGDSLEYSQHRPSSSSAAAAAAVPVIVALIVVVGVGLMDVDRMRSLYRLIVSLEERGVRGIPGRSLVGRRVSTIRINKGEC